MSGLYESITNLVNTLFKNVFWYITQKRYEWEVLEYPWSLQFVPDHFKTQEMCKKVVEEYPQMLFHIPNHFKTQEMCKKAVEVSTCSLEYAPDCFKTQGTCEKAVRRVPCTLNMYPTSTRHRKCVMMQRAEDHSCWNMYPIGLWENNR